MEQKSRNSMPNIEIEQVIDVAGPRSSAPEYFVDLTVDSPSIPRARAPLRRSRPPRRHHCDSTEQAESLQIDSANMPDLELIDHSNRLLPPKKRNRMSKSAKETPLINLDEGTPSEATARVNDSVSGESNVLSCPICFEYLTSKRKPTSTRCGHVYCAECIEQTLTMSKKCPKCQASITTRSCIRLYF